MLARVGVESVDELFDAIPEEVRLRRPLDLPPALSELELTAHMEEAAARNLGIDARPCFLGAGAYDHFIPAAVDALASRGEFFTAYTPYQAEASQGTLQAIFEYQTLVAQLTGMDVSNASLYDGGSAVAEAALMASATNGRTGSVVAPDCLHPQYRRILDTMFAGLPLTTRIVPSREGRIDPEALLGAVDGETAAVVLQSPNFFGNIEDLETLIPAIRERGAAAIVSTDPVSLGVLKRPGDLGADVVVAEGQGLGNALLFGGPYLGMLACREEFLRKIPGRLVGETTDLRGRRCWVLTLQTREQHIRRASATSNICTNQGLMALRASIHLALLGPEGLRQVAGNCVRKAHYAAAKLREIPGVSTPFPGPFFKEFAVKLPLPAGVSAAEILERVLELGYHGGVPLAPWYPQMADTVLVAVTEKRSKREIDGLAAAYREALAGA